MCTYTQYIFFDLKIIIRKREVVEIISYEPLWETMREKKVSQYRLLKSGIDNRTLDSLKKNKNITLNTLEKLCRILDCTPNDVVVFLDEISEA